MAIKFPLEVKDGVKARTLEELRENFDIEKIVGYFLDGKLLRWLEARYYEDEAEKISQLAKDDTELAKKLSEIFGVKYEQKQVDAAQIMRKKSRLEKLRQFTSDEEIIKNVDLVAFNQEELADLYDLGSTCIYLCEGEFTIPKSKQFIEYIFIGSPKIKGLSDKKSNIEQEEQTQRKTNPQEAPRKSATEESVFENYQPDSIFNFMLSSEDRRTSAECFRKTAKDFGDVRYNIDDDIRELKQRLTEEKIVGIAERYIETL